MVDFIGIGAQKAATTWLWSMLRQHPEVKFSPLKEVHYFDVLYLGMGREERMRAIRRSVDREIERLDQDSESGRDRLAWLLRVKDESFAFTDAWYRHLFNTPGGGVTGDITPFYCALPDEGIRHVRRLAPQARLIYMIRDPLARGLSSLRYGTRNGQSPERVFSSRRFFARGDYRSNIPRWESHFAPSQILYLPFGDVKARPLELLRQVEQHIGVAPFDGYRATDEAVNVSAGIELVITEELARKVATVFAGQREFLEQRFGSDFVARIS